jgi:hypothetical protein
VVAPRVPVPVHPRVVVDDLHGRHGWAAGARRGDAD